jgi:CBS domain-containing protein
VEVLGEGESLAPSLLDRPSGALVRAYEDSLCYLLPTRTVEHALSAAATVGQEARTLEGRLADARRTAPWRASLIRDLARPALVLPAETSIRDAAARMTDEGETCLVVAGDDAVLVTDRDLREQVIVGGTPADTPLATLTTRRPAVVSPSSTVVDALVDMLDVGADHILVRDGAGRTVGVVDHAALLELDGPNPLTLRREIGSAPTVDAVAMAVAALPAVTLRLLDGGVEPLDILALLAATSDAVSRRLLDLAFTELGPAPSAWAWLALGSEARREQTLATDQDNGLAFEPCAGCDAYYAALAERMNAWLARCGYAECRAGVMARNAGWRLTSSGWLELVETWLRTPTTRDAHIAMIGLDLRRVSGPLAIEHELGALVATAPSHPSLLERLASGATERRPPIGFLRGLVVESGGAHRGTLDIKTGGVAPVVDLARAYAVGAGSTATGTIERLHAGEAGGTVSGETAAALRQAFVVVNRVRLEHQAAQVERGLHPDNHVDPHELPTAARQELKEAFRAIAAAQRTTRPRTATRIP